MHELLHQVGWFEPLWLMNLPPGAWRGVLSMTTQHLKSGISFERGHMGMCQDVATPKKWASGVLVASLETKKRGA